MEKRTFLMALLVCLAMLGAKAQNNKDYSSIQVESKEKVKVGRQFVVQELVIKDVFGKIFVFESKCDKQPCITHNPWDTCLCALPRLE